MENPLSLVKQTRTIYRKDLERQVVEVQVEVKGAPKAWIPVETLLALVNLIQNPKQPQNQNLNQIQNQKENQNPNESKDKITSSI